jgi:hypothetical protein
MILHALQDVCSLFHCHNLDISGLLKMYPSREKFVKAAAVSCFVNCNRALPALYGSMVEFLLPIVVTAYTRLWLSVGFVNQVSSAGSGLMHELHAVQSLMH